MSTPFAVKAAADQLRLVHAILDHQNDHLNEDATVLLAEWLMPAPPASDSELVTAPPGAPLDLPV